MAQLRTKAMQKNFTAGEFSRKMDARVDLSKYENAAKTVENFIVYPQGGVTRRPGFRYIADVKTHADEVRLIPFEYSTEQAYILEFGDLYFRIYMNGGQVTSADANTLLLLHGAGDTIVDSGATVHAMTASGDCKTSVVQSKYGGSSIYFDWSLQSYCYAADHANWDTDSGGFTWEAFVYFNDLSAGARRPMYQQYQDDANYAAFFWDDPNQLIFRQRHAVEGAIDLANTWVPVEDTWYHVALVRDGNVWTMYIDGAALTTTATDTSDYGNNTGTFDIGKYTFSGSSWYMDGFMDEVRFSDTARYSTDFQPPIAEFPLGGVGGSTPTTVVTPWAKEYLHDLKFAQSADKMWVVHPAIGANVITRTSHTAWTCVDATMANLPVDPAMSITDGSDDCPSAVGFFEERLWFGGSVNNPQTLWSTDSGDFEDMGTAADAAASIQITFAADQVNAIRSIEPGAVLHVFTTGGEWRVSAGDINNPIKPDDIVVKRQTTYGSANIQPVSVGKHVIFTQKAALKLREYGFNFDVDGFISSDLNLLSNDITEGGLKYIAYQQEPYSILWSVLENGTLLGLTYQRDHEVVGWHRHTIGGTGSEVESVAVIPGSNEDELWAAIKTTIDGDTKRFVCQMQPIFSGDTTIDAFFVDFGLTYDGAAVTSVTGLDHLEAEAVDVLADGATLATTPTVTSGAIALGASYSVVHAGFSYNSNLELLRLEKSIAGTDIQGLIKRIWQLTLRLYESKEVKFGPDTSDLEAISYFDATTSTETGDFTQGFPGDYDQEGYVYIRQDQPLPLTVLGVIEYFETADE